MTNGYTPINMTNVNSTQSFLAIANSVTSGWFWTGMDFMIFLVIFITLSATFGFEAGFLSAAFIGIVLSILLIYLSLIPLWIAGVFIGGLIAIIIYIIWRNPYD